MIVVDTNLIAYLFIEGEHSAQAERVLEKDPEWAAPLLWASEFRNVLVKCVRSGLVEMADAYRIMAEAESLMSGGEYALVSAEVLEIATISSCSAYDAEFVALARDLGVTLVTLDKAVLGAFPETAVAPSRFLGAPVP